VFGQFSTVSWSDTALDTPQPNDATRLWTAATLGLEQYRQPGQPA
jgi:hypothetical protein